MDPDYIFALEFHYRQLQASYFNPLPNDNFFDRSKLKELADNKMNGNLTRGPRWPWIAHLIF